MRLGRLVFSGWAGFWGIGLSFVPGLIRVVRCRLASCLRCQGFTGVLVLRGPLAVIAAGFHGETASSVSKMMTANGK